MTPTSAQDMVTRAARDQATREARGSGSTHLVEAGIRDARYAKALDAYLRRGVDGIPADNLDLLTRYSVERRDLGTGTSTAGGYLVPPAFLPKLTIGLKRGSAMVRACNVIETDSGALLRWPTTEDTGNIGAILAENTAAPTQDVTFGSRSLGAFTYTSKAVRASLQLVLDAAFELEPWLMVLLGRRIGRALNAHLTNGTGGGAQPTGLIPNATVGVTAATGATTTITYDAVIDLIASVDAEYLEPYDDDQAPMPGRTGFMTSAVGLTMLRKVKDSAGAPIVTEGQPATVLGYPVIVNNDVPSPAAGARSIAFGNFGAGYVVRVARQRNSVLRLDERYGESLQVGWIGFGAFDGAPDDTAAVRLYQQAAG